MKYVSLFVLCLAAFTVTANDSVHIKAIPHALAWNASPAAVSGIGANAVTLTAGKGTDLYSFVDGSFYVNSAPKLLFTPDSNFIFSAKFKPKFRDLYDGVAILLYTDSSNWAKILWEQMENNTLMIGSSVVVNKITDDSYHSLTPGTDAVYLKLVRSGLIYCFYYSSDGKNWLLQRTFSYKNSGNLRIGFYLQSPKGEGLTADVSEIRYKPAAFNNFFTGE
jgi:regulation of enolase protein 1 (concanavalin A-like superfamily)